MKQKVVSYLGSIAGIKKRDKREEVIGEEFNLLDKRDFYQHVQKNLNKLDISRKEKEKALQSLSLKIPRTSLKEIKQAKVESKARLEKLIASFNNIPNLVENTINKLKRNHGENFNSTSRIRTPKKRKNL